MRITRSQIKSLSKRVAHLTEDNIVEIKYIKNEIEYLNLYTQYKESKKIIYAIKLF